MKLVFNSPFQAEVDIIDHGIIAHRDVPFDVSDELGEVLLENPHFNRVQREATAEAEPSAQT